MMYYKIKPEYDNIRRSDGSILIGNELYTPKEMIKYKIPFKYTDTVNVKPNEKYFFFGARMSINYHYPIHE